VERNTWKNGGELAAFVGPGFQLLNAIDLNGRIPPTPFSLVARAPARQ
jgi:hypothetical protein